MPLELSATDEWYLSPTVSLVREALVKPPGRRGFLVSSGNAFLCGMARYIETVMVRDGGRERAVRVTIDSPSLNGLDIQALAQEVWLRTGKKMVAGNVTIRVEKFTR